MKYLIVTIRVAEILVCLYSILTIWTFFEKEQPKMKRKFQSILFVSKEVKGKSQLTHIGGRSEIFDVENVELLCIGGNVEDPDSTWQLNAEISDKRFVSHTLTGPVYVRCNVGQLIHYDERWRKSEDFSSSENAENFWQEFHSADIAFKNKKPVSVIYRHMRFKDGEWTEVASYSAKFDEVAWLETYDGRPPQPLGKMNE